MKVVKFGGSSLANAEQFEKVGEIIRSDSERRYVVPSAPGKRFSGDTKVTDLLYQAHGAAEAANEASGDPEKIAVLDGILAEIRSRYQEIIDGLGIDLSLEQEFVTIRRNLLGSADKDYAASRGEYLNGIVMANYLG